MLYFVTLGRVVIGLYFLLGGLAKIFGPLPVEQIALMATQGIPAAEQMFVLAGACEATGGICLIIGLHTRLVALLLALFCVLASVTMHAFWQIPDADAQRKLVQMVFFLKNMTTMAGLFAFVGFGPGPLALDRLYGRGMIV